MEAPLGPSKPEAPCSLRSLDEKDIYILYDTREISHSGTTVE